MSKLTSLLALPLLLVSVACVPVEHERGSRTFEEIPTRLLLDVESGTVILRATEDGPTVIQIDARYSRRAPEIVATLVDGELLFQTKCATQVICDVEVEISLPASTELDLRIVNGSLEADGFTAPLRADLTNGSVELSRMSGPLDLAVTRGSVSGFDLSPEQATIDACAGSIDLEFRSPADVWAEACTGSIDLRIPAGAYRLELASSTGSVSTSGVGDDPAASRIIHAHTSVGSVEIIGR